MSTAAALSAKPDIVVEDAHRSFGAVEALRGIRFEVRPGEIYGLVGPDGAGKTTTIRLLAGLMRPTHGAVRVLGDDPASPSGAVREQLGLMPQRHSLYGDLSIAENLDFFGRLFCLDRATFAARRARLLDITRLGRFEDRRADALSGGMYKKLALACALLHQPRVLLLDEPTNGVDPVSRRELWDLLYEFVAEGTTVVVSTPYMDEAARCHRVGLLYAGTIIATGAPRALVRDFEHVTYQVGGPDQEALERWASARAELLAFSAAGGVARMVVRRHDAEAVRAQLVSQGRPVAALSPSFEDVFLARIAERSRA